MGNTFEAWHPRDPEVLMPWSLPMDQRRQLIKDLADGVFSVSELSDRYHVARKTVYKWLNRYQGQGDAGLRERSRRPIHCPHHTPDWIEDLLVEVRRSHPAWGPKKLLAYVVKRRLVLRDFLPGTSTTGDILKRQGLVAPKRRRRSRPPSTRPVTPFSEPNDVWTADFKGHFPTCDGQLCYPLTICDGFSRFLLACAALPSTQQALAQPVFERTFRTYGLPYVIRTDNGVPFATTALGRLSTLSVWWIRLGIRVEHTRPATPSDNGRHERMHRTLKAACTRPPAANLHGQQRLFDAFRHEYNHDRPHEALDQNPPASLYVPSPRPFPRRLPDLVYPGHYHLRTVGGNGAIRWRTQTIFLTHALEGQVVGLHEIDDGIWSIVFSDVELGRWDERRARFFPGGAIGTRQQAAHKK
jgi:putative transposase